MASKKSLNSALRFLNYAIERKVNNLSSFKSTRLKFMKKINSMDNSEASKRIKSVGGNSLSKKSFVNMLRYKTSSWGGVSGIALDVAEKDLQGGAKSLRRLKKSRKNLAQNRKSSNVTFIRRGGRVIPIRKKK